jgi:hypothetical protein
LYLHSLEFLVSCERFGRNFGYLILFQAAKRDKFVKRKEEKKQKNKKGKDYFKVEFLSRISRTKYSRGNGRLMINNNDDGDDVSSFSGSLFSFPIWFPIKMKVLLKEYLDSRCALIYPIVSSLDSRLELFKLFLRIGSILFSVSIQFGKRKKKKFFTSEKVDALAEETISLLSFASFEFID